MFYKPTEFSKAIQPNLFEADPEMKFSLVTTTYNSAQTVKDTVQSVNGQTHPDLEHVIIDGGSTDETVELIQQIGQRLGNVISEPDNGIYDAINKGIQQSTGDVVGLIHSDDLLAYPEAIADLNQIFETNPDIEAVYADLQYVDREDTSKVIRNWVSGSYEHGLFRKGWMPPHPTFYVKKACYDRLGLYTMKLKSAADYELMLRYLHKNKIKVGYLPKVLVKMRVGGMSNVSLKNRIRANKEDRLAWEMNGLQRAPFTTILKPLSKLRQFIFRG